jgi:Insertion element 4 transposase N-terminal/Transposase DDE domain
LRVQSVISRVVTVAVGVFAPGHLGELTQVIDFALVDAVAAETGTVQRRTRLLPTRVVVFFVLALALFERCSYRQVWGKLVAGLGGVCGAAPSVSGLVAARRRVGAKPLRALFEAVCGPVADPSVRQAFWRGLRTVAVDATVLRVPDRAAVRAVYRKRAGDLVEFGYPLLRLVVVVECGTRALLGAVFGSEREGEAAYARRLLGCLGPGMLLLADAYYDSWQLMADTRATGAHWLIRSGARRTPLISARLADGSYLSVLGYGRLKVRIVEAWITVRLADGTVRTQQWRLVTSLLDPRRYPAGELLALYHERWEIETTFYSIKCTILDARVLRSTHPGDIDQEVWALLALYQAIIRLTIDATSTRTGTDPDRASFTTALETARDQVTAAAGILPTEPILITEIGRAVLAALHPPRRQRTKARTRKLATSKYSTTTNRHPRTAQNYTIHTRIAIMEQGLTARTRH